MPRHPTRLFVFLASLIFTAGLCDQGMAASPLEGKVWGHLEGETSQQAIAEMKTFGEKAIAELGLKGLKLYETDYFLFTTDLDVREAAKWYGLLDKMYVRLLQLFDIPKGTNVWHGKALVFVFKNRPDFIRYEAQIEKYQVAEGIAGLCHQRGPLVRIAFYRQPDESSFATVLVHEASHGFLHRYRSPVHVVPWVNEGLAEWIAYDLVPRSKWKQGRIDTARTSLNRTGSTGDMFGRWSGEEQYGIAYTLNNFMIEKNKRGYVNFINAIKDGKDWEDALKEDYGTDLDRLLLIYGKDLRVQRDVKR